MNISIIFAGWRESIRRRLDRARRRRALAWDGKWVSDSDGNRANAERFGSRKAAVDLILSLHECTGCIDCVGLQWCKDCVDCVDCSHCVGCVECTDCAYLKGVTLWDGNRPPTPPSR